MFAGLHMVRVNESATHTSWALVTGACSGIGLAISLELAARGFSLFVLSNRCGEIEAVAERIRREFGVQAESMHLDLSRPEAARELYETVSARGIEVEVLVSNAGIFFFGEVVDTDPERILTMLHLHVVTPSLLAHYFGRDMRERRSGHILFVSSASSWKDFPGMAFYGSSKRFVRSLATSLRDELRPWGVNVTCLAPGAVATDLYDTSTGAARTAARLGLLKDPSSVARAAVKGMLNRRGLVLPGAGAKAMAVGMALIPRPLIGLARRHTSYLSRPGA
jgi:short-subunit dehydrogenase